MRREVCFLAKREPYLPAGTAIAHDRICGSHSKNGDGDRNIESEAMPRIDLVSLANDHAARRLNKKERNRELRSLGIDPSGQDGKLYRAALDNAIVNSRYAERVADVLDDVFAERGSDPDVIVLWDLPAAEWPEWIRTGCGDCTLTEYRERLDSVEAELTANGHAVARCSATVDDVLRVLKELGLRNDSPGRAAAIGKLFFDQGEP